jgi:type III secretory pathway lipoprotein EscJ
MVSFIIKEDILHSAPGLSRQRLPVVLNRQAQQNAKKITTNQSERKKQAGWKHDTTRFFVSST